MAVEGLRRERVDGRRLVQRGGVPRRSPRSSPGCRSSARATSASRVWSGPAITVTGIDVPSGRRRRSTRSCRTRARRSACASTRRRTPTRRRRRVDPAPRGGAAVRDRARRCSPARPATGFLAETTGPAYEAARDAMRAAWGSEASYAATGGSIPLVSALQRGGARGRDPAARHDATATRTSTRRTSACCSTSSRRRSSSRPSSSAASPTAFAGRDTTDDA